MFYWLSKFLWFLVQPINLIFLGICAVALLLVLRWHRAARYLAVTMAATCLLLAIMPAGHLVSQALENRFPANPPLPEKVAGIVVLGGVISPYLSQARGQVQFGDGMERVAATVDLMRRYPNARVIFTGGAGDPFHQDLKEAHFAPDVFAAFGADPGRVMFEAESRNTFENAKFSLALAKPQPGETWLLVTSAFHMPRSVGVFRKAGWRVVAYPVDYDTPGNESFSIDFSFRRGLGGLTDALRECLGLLFYRLTGRTDDIFPGPEQ